MKPTTEKIFGKMATLISIQNKNYICSLKNFKKRYLTYFLANFERFSFYY